VCRQRSWNFEESEGLADWEKSAENDDDKKSAQKSSSNLKVQLFVISCVVILAVGAVFNHFSTSADLKPNNFTNTVAGNNCVLPSQKIQQEFGPSSSGEDTNTNGLPEFSDARKTDGHKFSKGALIGIIAGSSVAVVGILTGIIAPLTCCADDGKLSGQQGSGGEKTVPDSGDEADADGDRKKIVPDDSKDQTVPTDPHSGSTPSPGRQQHGHQDQQSTDGAQPKTGGEHKKTPSLAETKAMFEEKGKKNQAVKKQAAKTKKKKEETEAKGADMEAERLKKEAAKQAKEPKSAAQLQAHHDRQLKEQEKAEAEAEIARKNAEKLQTFWSV